MTDKEKMIEDVFKSAQGFMSIEPQQEDIAKDGTLTVRVADGCKVTRVLVCGDNHFGGLYYPDEDAESKWIPVSERLPEEGKDVLTCFYTGEGNYKMMVSRRSDYNYWSGVGRTADMVAWMPLPKPYEPQEGSGEG